MFNSRLITSFLLSNYYFLQRKVRLYKSKATELYWSPTPFPPNNWPKFSVKLPRLWKQRASIHPFFPISTQPHREDAHRRRAQKRTLQKWQMAEGKEAEDSSNRGSRDRNSSKMPAEEEGRSENEQRGEEEIAQISHTKWLIPLWCSFPFCYLSFLSSSSNHSPSPPTAVCDSKCIFPSLFF